MSAEDSNEDILALVEAQNEGLVVESWKIFMRKIINKRHVELRFSVDGASMKTLKNCDFVLDYKFGNAPIRKKVPKGDESEKMEVDNTVADTQDKTGDQNVGKYTTNEKVPESQNMGQTRTDTNEANSTLAGAVTGDDEVGGNTTNQNVPGRSGIQDTGRTRLTPEYRRINIPAGNMDCQAFSGEQKIKAPKSKLNNHHSQ